MKINEAITILKQHNEWRRRKGDEYERMGCPKELGKAIDLIVAFAENVTGEPSGDMQSSGDEICYNAGARNQFVCETEVFKAMINQAILEVEDEAK